MSYEYAQSHRREQESKYWGELRRLANENKVADFYMLYAEYLEWNNILSSDRKAIHKMAVMAANLLEEKQCDN